MCSPCSPGCAAPGHSLTSTAETTYERGVLTFRARDYAVDLATTTIHVGLWGLYAELVELGVGRVPSPFPIHRILRLTRPTACGTGLPAPP